MVKNNNLGFAVKANDHLGLYQIIKKTSKLNAQMKHLIRVRSLSLYKEKFEINRNLNNLIKILKK